MEGIAAPLYTPIIRGRRTGEPVYPPASRTGFMLTYPQLITKFGSKTKVNKKYLNTIVFIEEQMTKGTILVESEQSQYGFAVPTTVDIEGDNMNYNESLEYINKASAEYGISMGLETITILLEKLGTPQNKVKVIHVAGTNGKGSVSTFIACILSEAGYKVGRYVSPAVMGYREKVQLVTSDKVTYITEEEVSEHVTAIADMIDEMQVHGQPHPTPFEIETAMAFMVFDSWKCDWAIVECGMGGRDDATNVIDKKELCVFTTIALDHTGYLGTTIEEIAANKAGILRDNVPAVSSRQCQEAAKVLNKCASQYSTVVDYAGDYKLISCGLDGSEFKHSGIIWYIPLLGMYQPENAVTAICAVKKIFGSCDYGQCMISDDVIQAGLGKAVWPRRLELVGREPYVLIDGAHNPNGINAFVKSVDELFPHDRFYRIGVMGVFADKNVDGMLELIKGKFDEIHTVTAPSVRAMTAGALAGRIRCICGMEACAHEAEAAFDVVDRIRVMIGHKDTSKDAGNDVTPDKQCTLITVFGSLSLMQE